MAISVIMPACNAAPLLARSLAPLVTMRQRGEILEFIVVDDGSDDDSAAIAESLGARLCRHARSRGPAAARNTGVQAARGAILWFLDADVVVHDNAAGVIAQAFHQASVTAVFGSYDREPAAPNFLSQYKNLVHHYTHQRGRLLASTFWTGCGAVRRSAFEAIEGFDAERFGHIGMEDIDFGYRLSAAGGVIRLHPGLLCRHLKEWRLTSLIRTEIFHRALPWSRMLCAHHQEKHDLNIGDAERLRAVVAFVATMTIALSLTRTISPWFALLALLLVSGANARLLHFFTHERGLFFGLKAIAFHQVYYLYSSATFAFAWLEARIKRRPSKRYRSTNGQ